jgi:hypothetical protein
LCDSAAGVSVGHDSTTRPSAAARPGSFLFLSDGAHGSHGRPWLRLRHQPAVQPRRHDKRPAILVPAPPGGPPRASNAATEPHHSRRPGRFNAFARCAPIFSWYSLYFGSDRGSFSYHVGVARGVVSIGQFWSLPSVRGQTSFAWVPCMAQGRAGAASEDQVVR